MTGAALRCGACAGLVITSYSIHYTKLYEGWGGPCRGVSRNNFV
ncbi:hypothetical protein [Streptomyces cyaneogriseus]|nr:hypothetical protein [Streptomyces cyaneogriseus]